jgi:hypothetical protein
MAGIFESAKQYLPNITAQSMTNFALMAVAFVVIGIIIGVVSYFIWVRVKYDKKIVVFERIGQRIEPTRHDKAMEYKIVESGDTLFYLKKAQKWLPLPTIQTGIKTYWFFIREDGEWINIGLGDIDKQMKAANVFFLDKDMRYARVAMQRLLEKRLQKQPWYLEYAGVIMYIGLIFVTGLVMWLMASKFVEVANASAEAIKSSKEVLDATRQILGTLDSLKGTGALVAAS